MKKLVNEGATVHALVHALKDHHGPSYYPPSKFHKALPEMDLTLTPTSCRGKASELGAVKGGQSTFNPEATKGVINAELVPLQLARVCNRVGGAPNN